VNKRSAICSVVVVMSSMTVLAQDSQSGIIHINGGANTVAIGATAQQPNAKGIEPAAHPFYDNIGTSGYQQYVGYAVCDGISACGGEQQAMHQPGRRSQSEPPLSGNGQEHAHFLRHQLPSCVVQLRSDANQGQKVLGFDRCTARRRLGMEFF